jgi:hypothetical protein
MNFTFEDPHLIKLLGTYELEIHPAFQELRAIEFTKIINIGAAEGYYAVGSALLWPKATVYAFESAAEKRNAMLLLRRDNGLHTRVCVNGTCGINDLIPLMKQPRFTLLICDIEGQEKEILRPEKISGPDETHIIVETHDMYVADSSKSMKQRFQKTHFIQTFSTRHRNVEDFPIKTRTFLNVITKSAVIDLMEERRPAPQDFLFMIPQNSPLMEQKSILFENSTKYSALSNKKNTVLLRMLRS